VTLSVVVASINLGTVIQWRIQELLVGGYDLCWGWGGDEGLSNGEGTPTIEGLEERRLSGVWGGAPA